jgi:hypothetical protein
LIKYDKRYDLINLVVKNLEREMAKIRNELKQKPNLTKEEIPNYVIFICFLILPIQKFFGFRTFKEYINQVFIFLGMIIKKSDSRININIGHLKRIWQ